MCFFVVTLAKARVHNLMKLFIMDPDLNHPAKSSRFCGTPGRRDDDI